MTNKLIISTAAALAFCSFDIAGSAVRAAEANNSCICSFLTVAPSCSGEHGAVIEKEDIEYSCKLYELLKKLFE